MHARVLVGVPESQLVCPSSSWRGGVRTIFCTYEPLFYIPTYRYPTPVDYQDHGDGASYDDIIIWKSSRWMRMGGVVGIPAVDPDCKEGDPGCIKGEADNGDDEEEELELKDEL
eukprot:COSAG06_NODE_2127_length_7536_cov_10.835821_8_plen_114_part_00